MPFYFSDEAAFSEEHSAQYSLCRLSWGRILFVYVAWQRALECKSYCKS